MTPMVARLGAGEFTVRILDDDGRPTERAFFVNNGFAKMAGGELTILAEEAVAAETINETEQAEALKEDIAILQKFEAAEDSLDEGVDLFPLPGVTPGMCGLLVSTGTYTTLVCGDAIPTAYTLENGTVHRGAVDIEQARESFKEAIEIADVLVLGRDNVVVNPVQRPF